MTQPTLFPERDPKQPEPSPKNADPKKSLAEIFNDYDSFVEKFKPKKTTDDCYTPPAIYEMVKQWVDTNIMSLDGVEIVRPFYPGGDYMAYDYPDGCLVLDNPPFSILAQIRRFYHARNIRYFLFAPSLTLASSARELDAVYIIVGQEIVYENGAKVGTSFITNLDCGETRLWCAGDLASAIKKANGKRKGGPASELPVYDYPPTVTSPALLQKVSKGGVTLRIDKDSCYPCTGLESQRAEKKNIYGGGWLLSERAAAERAAAREKICWSLSEREKEIIKNLK